MLSALLTILAVLINDHWSAGASVKTVQSKLNSYVHRQEQSFRDELKDTARLAGLMQDRDDIASLEQAIRLPYFLFLYAKDSAELFRLRFWNTQQVVPPQGLFFMKEASGFALIGNGYYVWNRGDMPGGKALALIPVKWNYPVTNEYLKNSFVVPGISSNYSVTADTSGEFRIRSVDGGHLFSVSRSGAETVSRNNVLSAFLLLTASLLLLIIIHFAASYISAQYGFWKGLLSFLIGMGGLRTISYYLPIPLNFRQYELFDPSVYGSSLFLRSLGDLFINAILFVWLAMFIRFQIRERKVAPPSWNPFRQWAFITFSGMFLVFLTFGNVAILRSLISDSNISFDVINFFTLTIYSVVGFFVLCCLAIGYYFLCQNVLYFIRPLLGDKFIFFHLIIAVTGLAGISLLISFSGGMDDIFFIALGWLLLFLLLINSRLLSLSSSGFISSRLIFWIFFFCLSIAAVIIRENRIRENGIRRHYAELFASKSDPSNETLLNTVLSDFRSATIWPCFGRFSDSLDNRVMKDSLLNLSAASYRDRYETRVLTFSSSGKALFNSDPASFNELNTIWNTQAKKTAKPGLYYFDESYEKFSYISKINIRSPDSLLGYIFIIASPKSFRSEALYPELFSRGRTSALEYSQLYSIGLYRDGLLFGSYNDYPFPTRLPAPRLSAEDFHYEEDRQRGYSILWHYAGAGRMVAIARENKPWLQSITLFSYLFCAFLLLMALLWIINGMVRSGLNRQRIRELWQFNIRNQIHGTIILISVVSFLFIGLATFFFFRNRYDRSNRLNLSRTAHIMDREIKNYLSAGALHRDTAVFSSPDMAAIINELSEVHGADINLFGLDGRLLHTSLPLPFTSGIIGPFMDPTAYFHLSSLHEVQFFQKETIGRLHFSSFYLPMMNAEGKATGYLQIPYFTAQYYLNQEISYFLVTIINLNAFIFLIAGIIALFITNRITGSLSMMAEKMRKVSLGGHNEPIPWKRNDEIGALVNEYNKMLAQLEESARSLALSEREGAWREMARQVAHEIKNPLTPMKLSLQYLQKSLANNDPHAGQLTREVTATLIEQIDHLNNIANEFNQFATLGQAGREEFDLNEVLQHVLSLFRSDPELKLKTQLIPAPVIVKADKTHINRIFTNLLKNAIQAVPSSRDPEIKLQAAITDGSVVVAITDNGEGIDEEVQPLIFTPNFTTKTSGSGLGLAICKRIAEQSGGNIRFETQKGKGTTFFVELPVVS